MIALCVLGPLAGIWLAAHLSPGPDFVLCVRMAVAQSRLRAIQAVGGICLGTAIWAFAGYYGVSTLFAVAPWLYSALKLCGGGYLVYLGIRLMLGSVSNRQKNSEPPAPIPRGTAFWLGLLTNLANPKAALFTTSLFAATIPADPPTLLGPAAITVMVIVSFCFYGSLVWALKTRVVLASIGRAHRWLDRVAAVVFVGLGVRFMWER